MKEKKNIQPENDKGQYHGYQEVYSGEVLWFRAVGKNNLPIKYLENHTVEVTSFFIR